MSLQSEMKKVYKKTRVYELDLLLAEESKWNRRQTISSNKLDHVRLKINRLAADLARKETQHGTNEENRKSTH